MWSAHRVYHTVPHQPLWNTPSLIPPPHCTPGVLHGTPSAFMEHPLPHSPTALHNGCTTRYSTPSHSPPALHTGCTTRYPASLYGTPPPSFPHRTAQRVYYTVQHPLPLPPGTAHRVYYTVSRQPLWNTPSLIPPPHCTPGVLHGTPSAFMEHPLPHSPTALHNGCTTRYSTPSHSPLALHTGCTTRYPASLYGTPPPSFPHRTAHQVYHTVPHQPLWNSPSPSPTASMQHPPHTHPKGIHM